MKRFKLTDNQAEAILNMRLRSLRKLEEFEIRTEDDALKKEQAGLTKLVGSDSQQWDKISGEIREVKEKFGKKTEIGRRRTDFAEAPELDVELEQATVEREPITVVCSDKGWIRALKGHLEDASTLTYKDGDQGKFVLKAETTDRIMVFASSGRFFTLEAGKLPGGRGHGEPLRLMADMEASDAIIAVFAHVPGRKLLVASSDGYGFIVPEDECLANTRKGKLILNVKTPAEAQLCTAVPAGADHVATVGDNRKLLIFKLAELPEMTRGKGVRLQKFKDGGLADARAFVLKDGLSWVDSSGRTWTVDALKDWVGERAQAGRLPPKGFPRNNRFG
jgi:topoisomerase-4 subunit A